MSKLKAIVLKGPPVVGNAIVYAWVRAAFQINAVNRPMPFTRTQLERQLWDIGTDLTNVLTSHRRLERAAANFKKEWKEQKPLTETAPM